MNNQEINIDYSKVRKQYDSLNTIYDLGSREGVVYFLNLLNDEELKQLKCFINMNISHLYYDNPQGFDENTKLLENKNINFLNVIDDLSNNRSTVRK